MKLSTKGRYGLRALIDLAIHTSVDRHEALSNVAERQNLSEIYLEQVFSTLRKFGIVQSVKGFQGGYLLADHPKNISVGMILRALEGDLSVMDDREKSNQDLTSITYCVKVNVWEKIDTSVENMIDSISLEMLVNDYKRLNHKDQSMYFI